MRMIDKDTNVSSTDCISRQAAKNKKVYSEERHEYVIPVAEIDWLPSAQPDYTELKQEFLRMASYIDILLECSDEQKETLNGFISRLSEYMPWTER